VEVLNLIENDLIEISNSIENDEGEKEDEEDNITGNGFIRIEDIKISPRSSPRKKSLKYIINISSDKEASLKRSRRNSHARRVPRKSL
jgi:hypothetical protein